MENENLATELLHEVRLQAKRWFIAFCIMVGVEVATIAGFMWYISLPIDETEVVQTSDGNSVNNSVVGGDYNGGETDNQEEAKSSSDEAEQKE